MRRNFELTDRDRRVIAATRSGKLATNVQRRPGRLAMMLGAVLAVASGKDAELVENMPAPEPNFLPPQPYWDERHEAPAAAANATEDEPTFLEPNPPAFNADEYRARLAGVNPEVAEVGRDEIEPEEVARADAAADDNAPFARPIAPDFAVGDYKRRLAAEQKG